VALVDRAPTLNGAPFAPGGVRYQRLVIDRPDCSLVVDLHPGITVALVRGDEAPTATRLAAAALEGDDAGVHLEFTDASGRHLVAFRPHGGRARVVDVDEQVEVAAWSRPEPTTAAAELHHLAAVEPQQLVEVTDRLFAAVEAEGLRESARRDRGRRSRRGRARAASALAAEAAESEAARAAWASLVPGVGPAWAVEHATEVGACAEAARRAGALSAVDRGEVRAQAVVATVASLLAQPADRPQVLALPAPGLGPAECELLFDLLPDVLRGRQVLVVTDSPRVAAWARLESLAGRAALAEPDLVIGAI